MKIVTSKVTNVEVFPSGALVTRTGKVNLSKGQQIAVFTHLPSQIEARSIQVSGSGKATLMDVTSQLTQDEGKKTKQVEVLEEQIKLLQLKCKEIDDAKSEVEEQRKFIDNISRKLTSSSGENDESKLSLMDPSKWGDMLKFHRDNHQTLNSERRKLNEEGDKLQKELNDCSQELAELQKREIEKYYEVVIKLDVPEETELMLQVSYLVQEAKWKPSYDIRVDSNNKVTQLLYKALISQNTSEKWEETKISLSTAQPQRSASQKRLSAEYINFYKLDKRGRPVSSGNDYYDDEYEEEHDNTNFTVGGLLDSNETEIVDSKISVNFNIAGMATISSNNEENEVTITRQELESELMYSTMPKLQAHTFLKTKIQNKSNYPLLDGTASVFLDNSFITKSKVEFTSPSDEFEVSLGVDKNITVEYVFINDFESNQGLITKTKKIERKYKHILTNHKPVTETVILKDNLPITKHKEVIVNCIKPDLSIIDSKVKKMEHEMLEWTVELQPGEKKEIEIEYTIEYPKNSMIIFENEYR